MARIEFVPLWMDDLEGMENCVAYLPQLQLRHRKVQKIMMKSEEKSSEEASIHYYLSTIFHYENSYIE